ncbi:metal dependent phosphohydrolase [Halothece sp. PCC 7418]|uniref:HD domain-containing protein n=1 Tax=Halothece sp. (strain PCC 7418) TaxID=65093 RepID=UPI0002A06649|nr:HD domain-containing protein [Halothece sp. PCC 7418]AFZ42481.1 metal dependent phosphohydrolase [Halothece sp. PCC 7418]
MKLSPRFSQALTFANDLHLKQKRKGSHSPYISHLLTVCSLVLEYGGDEDCAIAALLHDAIEDQGGAATRETIRLQFGERVTTLVDGCTESDQTPKPPWQKRKEAYIAHIPKMSDQVALISAADKIHNARSILRDYQTLGEEIWERFRGGKEGTLWYYRSLVSAFRKRNVTPIVEELTTVVDQLEAIAYG